jgi:hypothetical protein
MIRYLREIRARRAMLVARALAERSALAEAVQPLARAVTLADRAQHYARGAATVLTAVSVARGIARWASASR